MAPQARSTDHRTHVGNPFGWGESWRAAVVPAHDLCQPRVCHGTARIGSTSPPRPTPTTSGRVEKSLGAEAPPAKKQRDSTRPHAGDRRAHSLARFVKHLGQNTTMCRRRDRMATPAAGRVRRERVTRKGDPRCCATTGCCRPFPRPPASRGAGVDARGSRITRTSPSSTTPPSRAPPRDARGRLPIGPREETPAIRNTREPGRNPSGSPPPRRRVMNTTL